MNLRALGRALGFMFLPTFAILVVLIVGFFNPVAMWTWIKSNDGWAIFTRVAMLLAEIVLVVILYFQYLREEIMEAANNKKFDQSRANAVSWNKDVYDLFNNRSSDDYYFCYKTKDPDIVIVERKPKN